MRKILLIMTVLVLGMLTISMVSAQDAPETAVQFIELTGPASIRDAEISSLVWYGDYLLMITENPFIYATEGNAGKFFALEKSDIIDYLGADSPEPLEPFEVPLISKDIQDAVGGYSVAFDGFEGAAVQTGLGYFAKDQIFLSIEADTVSEADPTMRGYLVSGTIAPDLSSITLDLDKFIELPYQTDFNNMSYEALLLNGDNLTAFYEVNGEVANPDAVAYDVSLGSGELTATPIDHLNYRLTDVTSPDENGMFWATNYFFVGEDFLAADDDPLFATYGMGAKSGGVRWLRTAGGIPDYGQRYSVGRYRTDSTPDDRGQSGTQLGRYRPSGRYGLPDCDRQISINPVWLCADARDVNSPHKIWVEATLAVSLPNLRIKHVLSTIRVCAGSTAANRLERRVSAKRWAAMPVRRR